MANRHVTLTLHPDDYELLKEMADQRKLTVDEAVSQIFRGMLKTSIEAERQRLELEQGHSTQH